MKTDVHDGVSRPMLKIYVYPPQRAQFGPYYLRAQPDGWRVISSGFMR